MYQDVLSLLIEHEKAVLPRRFGLECYENTHQVGKGLRFALSNNLAFSVLGLLAFLVTQLDIGELAEYPTAKVPPVDRLYLNGQWPPD